MKRVLAAMSGGVDSSLAAALLKEQGYTVFGVTMKLLDSAEVCGDQSKSCCGYDAARDAKLVADTLGIAHYTINAVDAFEKCVISDFIEQYRIGRTPNPCVRCNYYLKFDFLMKKARELGCEYLATGHYAVIENGSLRRGTDQLKDQSYFLYPVFAADISKIIFPLGNMCKSEVRQIARKLSLPTASKKESQDICFIPEGNYARFLRKRGVAEDLPGKIVDITGNAIGEHCGIQYYTVGQRKGLGALGKRMYVKEIRVDQNCVVAAEEEQLYSDSIALEELLLSSRTICEGEKFSVQVRYRSPPIEATVKELGAGSATLLFSSPVRAIAPGQSAVIYEGDRVVAGGIIKEAR